MILCPNRPPESERVCSGICNNINVRGKYIYAPIYMVMFIEKKNDSPTFYKVDLSGLN